MQQSTKIKQAIKWLIPFALIATFVVACNNETASEATDMDTLPTVVPAPDTVALPPIDTTATSRPEDGKTL